MLCIVHFSTLPRNARFLVAKYSTIASNHSITPLQRYSSAFILFCIFLSIVSLLCRAVSRVIHLLDASRLFYDVSCTVALEDKFCHLGCPLLIRLFCTLLKRLQQKQKTASALGEYTNHCLSIISSFCNFLT